MPSSKRERQKQARSARREAQLAAQRRARLRRRVVGAVVVGALVVGLLALLAGDGDDATDVAVDDSAPTTEAEPSDDTTGVVAFSYGSAECPPEGNTERRTSFEDAPARCIAEDVDYSAVIRTSKGDITIDLLEDRAPGTVNNFVFLARWNYYDGDDFHRVIPDFVAQGGDPVGDPPGTGDPGYRFADELPEAGAYEIGSVAMANAGADTNGSQFFVIVGDRGVQLPPNFSLFGTVTDGIDVAHAIEAVGTESGTPQETVTIDDVEIVES